MGVNAFIVLLNQLTHNNHDEFSDHICTSDIYNCDLPYTSAPPPPLPSPSTSVSPHSSWLRPHSDPLSLWAQDQSIDGVLILRRSLKERLFSAPSAHSCCTALLLTLPLTSAFSHLTL